MLRYLPIAVLLVGCATNNHIIPTGATPQTIGSKRCGIANSITHKVAAKYYRGPVDGGYDINGDGRVDGAESFTQWDFNQIHLVLNEGLPFHTVTWTNIDTCFKFKVIPHQTYEDPTQKAIWQTCRSFEYRVRDNHGRFITRDRATACRNFATREWQIL